MPAATGVVPARSVMTSHCARLCQRGNRAANEGRIARMLDQRGAALAFPATGLELQECFERRPDLVGLARDREGDGPVLFEAMALATQLLEFLGAERAMQQRFTILRRVEAGAGVGGEDTRLQAVAIENVLERTHRRAVECNVVQHKRMRSGLTRLLQQARGRLGRRIAVDQRAAQGAIGMRAHQRGQGDLPGAPERNHRHQPDQPRRRAVECG